MVRKSKKKIIFERNIRKYFPEIKCNINRKKKKTPYIEYKLHLKIVYDEIEYYESKNICIRFNNYGVIPKITVENSEDFRHRYTDGSLCAWNPRDPEEKKWTFNKGLLSLLCLIRDHLFKEAYFKENSEWLGNEIHQENKLQ